MTAMDIETTPADADISNARVRHAACSVCFPFDKIQPGDELIGICGTPFVAKKDVPQGTIPANACIVCLDEATRRAHMMGHLFGPV